MANRGAGSNPVSPSGRFFPSSRSEKIVWRSAGYLLIRQRPSGNAERHRQHRRQLERPVSYAASSKAVRRWFSIIHPLLGRRMTYFSVSAVSAIDCRLKPVPFFSHRIRLKAGARFDIFVTDSSVSSSKYLASRPADGCGDTR